MIRKFKKIPVVIEAIQWDGKTETATIIAKMSLNREVRVENDQLFILTLEGTMAANLGDWVIKGVKGEIYPCKPDIFEMTYEGV